MNERQDVAVRRESEAVKGTRATAATPTLSPAVDLFEDANGITLKADMPGVTSDGLDVEVRNQELIIEGKIDVAMPDNLRAWSADLRGGRYRRNFLLSQNIDSDKIEAALHQGVLTVNLPKRPEFRTRRITVK